jgi:hypothetical protein
VYKSEEDTSVLARIAEVKFFSRALTDNEIIGQYKGTKAGEESLEGYWTIKNNYKDYSGKNNNLHFDRIVFEKSLKEYNGLIRALNKKSVNEQQKLKASKISCTDLVKSILLGVMQKFQQNS